MKNDEYHFVDGEKGIQVMVRKRTEEESKGNIDKYSQALYDTGYKDGYEDATKAIISLINDFYKTGEI